MLPKTRNTFRTVLRIILFTVIGLIVFFQIIKSPVQSIMSKGTGGSIPILIGQNEYRVTYDQSIDLDNRKQPVHSTTKLEVEKMHRTSRDENLVVGEIVAFDPPTHVQIRWKDGSLSAPMIARWRYRQIHFRSDFPAWSSDGHAVILDGGNILRPGEWQNNPLIMKLWMQHLATNLGFGLLAILIIWLLTLKRIWKVIGPGCCPICGYDLRGCITPGCPECGWNREPNSR